MKLVALTLRLDSSPKCLCKEIGNPAAPYHRGKNIDRFSLPSLARSLSLLRCNLSPFLLRLSYPLPRSKPAPPSLRRSSLKWRWRRRRASVLQGDYPLIFLKCYPVFIVSSRKWCLVSFACILSDLLSTKGFNPG